MKGEPTAPKTPKRRRRPAYVLLILALATLCGWVGWTRSDVAIAASDLDNQLAAAKREGIPLTAADLNRFPPLPEKENAASDYLEIFATIDKLENKGVEPWDGYAALYSHKHSAKDFATIRACDLAMQAMMPKLEVAVAKPGIEFHRDWNHLPWPNSHERRYFRDLTGLLATHSRTQSQGGDTKGALETLYTAARMCSQFKGEPSVVGLLLRELVEGVILNQLVGDLKSTEMRLAILQRAADVVNALGPPLDYKYSLRDEVVRGLLELQWYGTKEGQEYVYPGSDDKPDTLRRLAAFKPLREAFESRLIKENRAFQANLPKDPEDFAQVAKAEALGREWTSNHHGISYLIDDGFPASLSMEENLQRATAYRRLALAAIWVLNQHARTGVWPTRLSIAGRQGQDPFDGKPLRYKLTKTGFVVYSIGSDLIDNGGEPYTTKPVPGDGSRMQGDLPFALGH